MWLPWLGCKEGKLWSGHSEHRLHPAGLCLAVGWRIGSHVLTAQTWRAGLPQAWTGHFSQARGAHLVLLCPSGFPSEPLCAWEVREVGPGP